MIHICWPQGCYGSYVMQSIYAYSNLGNNNKLLIDDNTGSSHTFRIWAVENEIFKPSHRYSSNVDVFVNPVIAHRLDYLNNSLTKEENNDPIQLFKKSFPDSYEADTAKWNTHRIWTQREWASFCINAWLSTSYTPIEDLKHITFPVVKNWFNTTDLFDTNINVFPDIINRLGLTVTADTATMKANQQQWIEKQIYHNSQHRCNTWVQDILKGNNTTSPCQTILDEAYVQHCLRKQGYEIRCDGLDAFPRTSSELKELLYENSKTDNQ